MSSELSPEVAIIAQTHEMEKPAVASQTDVSGPSALAGHQGLRIRALGILAMIHLGCVFAPKTFSWEALLVAAVMWAFSLCFGISIGWHRLLTHASFKNYQLQLVKYFFALCGVFALQGALFRWVGAHRLHHKYSDLDGDPHIGRQEMRIAHLSPLAASILLMAFPVCSEAADALQKRDLAKSKGHYILVLPPAYDVQKSYDLIVGIHGMGDTAENFARVLASMTKGRDSILAIPEGSNGGWSTRDLGRITETVEDAASNFKVDRKKVLLVGFSAGCAIGFYVIAQNPKPFACFAGLGMSIQSNLGITDQQLQQASRNLSIYYMVGKKDPNTRVFQATVDRLNRCGFKVKAEAPDIGHTISPEVAKSFLAFFDETVQEQAMDPKDLVQKKIGDAKARLDGGDPWGAYKAYEAIAADFKDIPESKTARPEADKLRDDPKVRKEFQARLILEKAKELLASRRKVDNQHGAMGLDTIIAQFPETEAANSARELKR